MRWQSCSAVLVLLLEAKHGMTEVILSGGRNMSVLQPRCLQETYNFMQEHLRCTDCCDEESQACDCILNCDLFKDKCDLEGPICEQMRQCYVKIDDADPKGYDFEWQCDLLKCIAYCLKHTEMDLHCTRMHETFQKKHCEVMLEIDLPDCDVKCSHATSRRSMGVSVYILSLALMSVADRFTLH
eukprot:gnl/MRDRNA2_/MRDRNA2_28314_c0_seq1.p1 gnl/MRDRNA2_/MRDRNA2_28314_c0~~gnl/MRDRNA2_/MRDRNA2_28314_c0_seq1.p1  ORF type:complete len:184 (+),score=23.86 gnl/MRDRNA2_/MRDRNA2_28314_c0_seq1:77-628(+)